MLSGCITACIMHNGINNNIKSEVLADPTSAHPLFES